MRKVSTLACCRYCCAFKQVLALLQLSSVGFVLRYAVLAELGGWGIALARYLGDCSVGALDEVGSVAAAGGSQITAASPSTHVKMHMSIRISTHMSIRTSNCMFVFAVCISRQAVVSDSLSRGHVRVGSATDGRLQIIRTNMLL